MQQPPTAGITDRDVATSLTAEICVAALPVFDLVRSQGRMQIFFSPVTSTTILTPFLHLLSLATAHYSLIGLWRSRLGTVLDAVGDAGDAEDAITTSTRNDLPSAA